MACARLLGKIINRNVPGQISKHGLVRVKNIHSTIQHSRILTNSEQIGHRSVSQIVPDKNKMETEAFNGLKPLVTFVLGGPGSGKGTQCKLICDEFGYKHLSAGDLLRAERNSPGSLYGEMIEKHIQEGRIVPVEVTCSLLEKAMLEHCRMLAANVKQETESKSNGDKIDGNASNRLRGKFLVDGFPRNEDNLLGWTRQMADKVGVTFVLFLDCPHDICIKRCLERGQQGSNRSDDNEVSLKKRLVTFTKDTMPIVQYYEKLHLVRKIDATKSPQEVYAEVRKLFS